MEPRIGDIANRWPALETAPGRTDYGVTVPDLPGCRSAGDTLDEALSNAEDAILTSLGVLVEDGKPLPAPSRNVPLELGPREVVGVINVDLEKIDPPRKALRLNVSIPGYAIDMIGRATGHAGTTGAGLLTRAALTVIEQNIKLA